MKIWLITVLFAITFVSTAQAHPHIFITPKAVIEMNNHTVSQINVEWDFDDMSSSLFLESCGSDNAAIYNLVFPDTQLLTDGTQVARLGCYTKVEIDGVPIDNLTPANFQASFVNGSLHCQFNLYINQTVDHSLKIWFDDPTIYNAFDVYKRNFQVDNPGSNEYLLQIQTENDIDKIYVSL